MLKVLGLMLLMMNVAVDVFAQETLSDIEAWRNSYSLENKGEYEKAASLMLPMLESDDDSEYALMRYGWLHYLQGNFNDAIRSYQRALKHNGRSIDARLGLALPLMAQNRWQEASHYLKQILALSPYHYKAHLRLMACEEGFRHWDDLVRHASLLAASYPSDTSVLVYLARAYLWQGKKELAKAIYVRVLKRYPEHFEAHTFLHRYVDS